MARPIIHLYQIEKVCTITFSIFSDNLQRPNPALGPAEGVGGLNIIARASSLAHLGSPQRDCSAHEAALSRRPGKWSDARQAYNLLNWTSGALTRNQYRSRFDEIAILIQDNISRACIKRVTHPRPVQAKGTNFYWSQRQ